MNTYTIVAGVDGVGESSLIGILKSETKSIGRVLNADDIADECLESGHNIAESDVKRHCSPRWLSELMKNFKK